MKHSNTLSAPPALTPLALALRSEIADGTALVIKEMDVAECTVQVYCGTDSLWLLVKRPGNGGFAVRTVFSPGTPIQVESVTGSDRDLTFHVKGSPGDFNVRLITPNSEEASIRYTVELTPISDIVIPYWPRDLYPIDSSGDPAGAEGVVKASQRGLNAGIVYLSLTNPSFGSLLYFQNFTALDKYFETIGSRPDGCVGGNWPELGYQMPVSESIPLKAGKPIVISDAVICWNKRFPESPQLSARLFLDLLSGIYRRLDTIDTEYHDWPSLAAKTLHDLQNSDAASITEYDHKYLHPYTAAEYPDSMVQLTVLMALREYAARDSGAGVAADELLAGVYKFFDKKLGTVRRYLPNVGKDKNKDAVDSWYLYHPVANLGRLAAEGDDDARKQFLSSAEFGIKVAQHFHYKWPVQFNIETFEIITGDRKPGDPGQSDTGGLYAYVMLQAYRLTEDSLYLTEAKNAIHGLSNMQFELEYQANITGWGANACLHLFLITGDDQYLEQSYVFLAGLFHNTVFWESEIGNAKSYRNFLAPTCLHDGPYMALYECYEIFVAFHEYLIWGKSYIAESVRMLLAEYCKFALTRAWYYYPANLPEDALSKEVRNGYIDRKLAFPLEDLYADGQPAGQVGQEIYGCGAAFALVTRSYHALKNAPFQLYCEYPIFDLQEADERTVAFRVRGIEGFYCDARIIPNPGKEIDKPVIHDGGVSPLRCHRTSEGHWQFRIPASRGIEICL
jgi:hypothetical protein